MGHSSSKLNEVRHTTMILDNPYDIKEYFFLISSEWNYDYKL